MKLFLLCLLLFSLSVSAQTPQTTQTTQISQPAAINAESSPIDSLMSLYVKNNRGTMTGYRVQLYYGNNQVQSKREADGMRQVFLNTFPNEGAYLEYEAPFWRLCVGDFRTYRDAKRGSQVIAKKLPQYGGNLLVISNQTINLPVIQAL